MTIQEPVSYEEFKPGNVYRRLAYTDQWGSKTTDPVVMFGIVQDVMNNGKHISVAALEFTTSYAAITPKTRIFTDDPEELYAATAAEVAVWGVEIMQAAQGAMEDAKRKYEAAVRQRDVVFGLFELSSAFTDTPLVPTGGQE